MLPALGSVADLRFAISYTRQVRALGSGSCVYHAGDKGTIYYGHRFLCDITHETCLVPSRTRQGVGFFLGIGLCCTRDGGYDLLRALVSASCEITHKARGTICCGHWNSASCGILHTRHGYNLLRALDSASCDITH